MAIFSGSMMDDILMGTMDDDVLWGGMGDDDLSGGAGDDRLIGGPGGDALDGGPNMDTADYTGSMYPVHVDLRSPFADDDDDPGRVYGGDAEGDMLTSIEHIWGSRGADTLIGNHVGNILAGNAGDDTISGMGGRDYLYGEAGHDVLMGGSGHDVLSGGMDVDELQGGTGNDILRGGDGDDSLYGMAGNDVLEGGGGADMLDGGEGSDTAAYTMSAEGVTINLSYVGTARPEATGGDAMGDEFMSIENVRGSMEDDKLTGDGEANKLYGNMGDDMLMGGAGNDMLRGGKGDDELEGGANDDTIRGDKGDDTLTGDAGNDTFVLMEGDGDDEITDFEQGKDTIQLGPATEKLSAADIRDVLDTEDDNRDGTYTYDWEDVSITVDVPLMPDDFGVQATSNRLTEGDDVWPDDFDVTTRVLRGPNVIHGLDGDDVIMGDDGDDTLFGNAGDDTLMGGDDDDDLSGGRGDDNLMGGSGRDMLYGGSGADTLSGNRGNDMLSGGSGPDTFWFGPRDGYDTITDFHQGDMISLGGSPLSMAEIDDVLDTVRVNDDGDYIYDWMDTRIVVNRPLTEDDFEKAPPDPAPEPVMLGPGGVTWPDGDDNSGDDSVYGGDGDDMIDGGTGMDTLKGMEGNDTLMGGDGDDMLTGGAGNDTFKFDAADGEDTITDFQRDADKIMLGDAPLSMSDADMVIKSQAPVSGGYQYTWGTTKFTVLDDPLMMSDLDYEAPTPPEREATPLTASDDMWPGTTDNSGDDYVDGLAGVDVIAGGAGNDTLEGGADSDTLYGGIQSDTAAERTDPGNDELSGGSGNDTLYGGAGNDELSGGSGVDAMHGDDGDDMIYADLQDASTDTANITGGDGDDTLSFMKSAAGINNGATPAAAYTVSADIENVIGSSGNDMLTLGDVSDGGSLMGGDGNDTLTGGTSDDMLDGGAGMDSLNGGGGNDTLDGGEGRDTLTGGAGEDVFVWGHGDVVTDYATGDNRFDTSALGALSPSQITLTDSGANVLVTITVDGVEQWMVLQGVADPNTVDISDFLL